MMDDLQEREPWGVVRWAAGSVVAAPVVVGFITLGAGVIVVRALADVAAMTWRRSRPDGAALQPPKAPARRRRTRSAATGGNDVALG